MRIKVDIDRNNGLDQNLDGFAAYFLFGCGATSLRAKAAAFADGSGRRRSKEGCHEVSGEGDTHERILPEV